MTIESLAEVPVGNEEQLARFVLFEKHVRKNDGTIKADAILPFKHVELSVSRHRGLSDCEVWELGRDVAEKRARPLVGRADFSALTARQQSLDVIPSEPPRNHANIVGWPPEKPAQMVRALEIAAQAKFTVAPPVT